MPVASTCSSWNTSRGVVSRHTPCRPSCALPGFQFPSQHESHAQTCQGERLRTLLRVFLEIQNEIIHDLHLARVTRGHSRRAFSMSDSRFGIHLQFSLK